MTRRKIGTRIKSFKVKIPGYTPYIVDTTDDGLTNRKKTVDEVMSIHKYAYAVLKRDRPDLEDPYVPKRRRKPPCGTVIFPTDEPQGLESESSGGALLDTTSLLLDTDIWILDNFDFSNMLTLDNFSVGVESGKHFEGDKTNGPDK